MSACACAVFAVCVLNVGGNWNNGSNAGLWYLNGNNGASNSNSNIGARLSYSKNKLSPIVRSMG